MSKMLKKYYWLETYGCQMNSAESIALEKEMKDRGWKTAPEEQLADIVILNTCAVRKSAENRIWGRIGHFQHLKKDSNLAVAVMGCMTQRLKEEFRKKAPTIDLLIGNFGKQDFINFIDKIEDKFPKKDFFGDNEYHFNNTYSSSTNFSALIPIMHGCNNFCTYCIVPHVRGREVSRSPEEIIKEIQTLDKKGFKEITLLGQNVNSYNYTKNEELVDFPKLLKLIASIVKNIKWIRFMSSHPKDFSNDLISVIKEYDQICNHIHLPVQHGSNTILKEMNRKYTREDYLTLVKSIKTEIPNATLSTDLLIGFPGETEQDFYDTIDLMKSINFDDAFTYKYNPREGTKAYTFTNNISEEIKSERLQQIIDIQRNITENQKRKRINNEELVLVEAISKKDPNELLARTSRNEMVVFKGDKELIGTFILVKLFDISGATFKAKEV